MSSILRWCNLQLRCNFSKICDECYFFLIHANVTIIQRICKNVDLGEINCIKVLILHAKKKDYIRSVEKLTIHQKSIVWKNYQYLETSNIDPSSLWKNVPVYSHIYYQCLRKIWISTFSNYYTFTCHLNHFFL